MKTAEEILNTYESFGYTEDGCDETHYYRDNVLMAMEEYANTKAPIKLKEDDALQCVFLGKDGQEHILEIYPGHLRELVEDSAFELLSETQCQESTCAVNNFCECEPFEEGLDFSEFRVRIETTLSIAKPADEKEVCNEYYSKCCHICGEHLPDPQHCSICRTPSF